MLCQYHNYINQYVLKKKIELNVLNKSIYGNLIVTFNSYHTLCCAYVLVYLGLLFVNGNNRFMKKTFRRPVRLLSLRNMYKNL